MYFCVLFLALYCVELQASVSAVFIYAVVVLSEDFTITDPSCMRRVGNIVVPFYARGKAGALLKNVSVQS